MSDQQLRDECLTIFLAGQETTALTLAWAWYLLSQNPAAAQSMYENVDSLLSGRLPTMDDIAQLSEVEYVVLEALRLYPAIHAIGREALVDTELGDFYCPRGTTLFMSPWAAQRNSHYFPNPDTFQPSRWRNGLEKRLPRGAFFPFSAGPRTCLGVHFAMVQMKLVLTLMAQRFQFTMTPGSTVIPVAQVTLQPSPGVPSLLTTR
jgi:cytochrome P450